MNLAPLLAIERVVELAGPNKSLKILGIELVGINVGNGKKFLFTLAFIIVLVLLNSLLRRVACWIAGNRNERIVFWTRQGVRLTIALLMIVGVVSIWFDQPSRLATAAGLLSAAVAFALQRVITAMAAYIVILRGRTFNVGDRITMGGVRGDVIALGFMQTTIMEMGQPPAVQEADPAMWVKSRQYTGRIVTVTNDKIFDTPVYNYTREFPYIWDEISLPVPYTAEHGRAEKILLDAAGKHAAEVTHVSEDDLREIERRYAIHRTDMEPQVYWRLTDNWLEMTVRFIAKAHDTRLLKDQMSREILRGFNEAGISVASSTFEIVGLPPLRLAREKSREHSPAES